MVEKQLVLELQMGYLSCLRLSFLEQTQLSLYLYMYISLLLSLLKSITSFLRIKLTSFLIHTPYLLQLFLKLMSQYGRAQYWEQRYSRDPGLFDWYQRYFTLRELIGTYIPTQFRILNVGSGNSRLSQQMFDDGYENITNIDISQTSIKAMNQLYKEKGPNFKYIQMDVRAMQFAENSFDAIIDKGTFDSVICGEGSNTNASKMLTEVYRVLGPNGVYMMITFGNPESRMDHLKKKQFQWGVWVHKLIRPTVTAQITPNNIEKDDKNYHFIYVCIKGKKNEQGQAVVEQKKEQKK